METSILERAMALLILSYDKYSKKHGGPQWSFLGVKKDTFSEFFLLKTPFFLGSMRFLALCGYPKRNFG